MIDVIVVGCGIAGSVVTHMARARGLSTLTIDPEPERSASRAALALGRTSWHSGDQRTRSAWSVRWYLGQGWAHFPKTEVSTSARPGWKEVSDYYLIDPIKPLVVPDVRLRVTGVRSGEIDTEGPSYSGRLVVVTAGFASWKLISGVGAGVRWGHTLVSATAKVRVPLAVHQYAPYRLLTVAEVNGEVRLGSSVAAKEADSKAQVYQLLARAEAQELVRPGEDWSLVCGIRALHPEETGKPIWGGTGLVTLAGFARCGYSLAPARADEVLTEAFLRATA